MRLLSRRQLLERSGLGFGSLALTYLTQSQRLRGSEAAASARGHDLTPRPGHFPARARAVIQLMQNGGPSQMDLFDPKPELQKRDGQRHVEKVEMFQPGSEANQLLASPFEFRRWGKCGMELSECIPHIGSIADDICLVRSMFSEHNNHTEALVMFQTCKIFPGRPTLGAWISYGLGTENQNLPAYIVLRDPEGYNTSGTLLWENGWLPALYRGTEFSSRGAPVLNLHASEPVDAAEQREDLELLARFNEQHRRRYPLDSELEARIRNYELAARMQLAAGSVLDLSKESEATQKLYGLDNPETAGYGTRLLMARRLVESGVRFVQVFPPIKPQFQPWDTHDRLKTNLPLICQKTDLPTAGLVRDLKSRGLLDEVIVLWSGEFGRLPVSQNGSGRDHNKNAFSLWLAGGGFDGGRAHGSTDDVGYRSVEKRVSVPDLHATILNQLGIDHQKLTYPHNGRPENPTDVSLTGAHVINELLRKPANA
ncbi:MAG: DUF1501 domain-containing protein [Acidobacteria bacterium]|nr:DUF1501 domain-containing protein [Acidobacteriota bacterium]